MPPPQTRNEMFERLHAQFRRPFTPLEFSDKYMEDEIKKKLKTNPSKSSDEKNMIIEYPEKVYTNWINNWMDTSSLIYNK